MVLVQGGGILGAGKIESGCGMADSHHNSHRCASEFARSVWEKSREEFQQRFRCVPSSLALSRLRTSLTSGIWHIMRVTFGKSPAAIGTRPGSSCCSASDGQNCAGGHDPLNPSTTSYSGSPLSHSQQADFLGDGVQPIMGIRSRRRGQAGPGSSGVLKTNQRL